MSDDDDAQDFDCDWCGEWMGTVNFAPIREITFKCECGTTTVVERQTYGMPDWWVGQDDEEDDEDDDEEDPSECLI